MTMTSALVPSSFPQRTAEVSRTTAIEFFQTPAELGERFRVPQLALRVQGELQLFDDPEVLEYPWDLSPYDAAPTADDLTALGAALKVSEGGEIDIDAGGHVVSRFLPDLQRDLGLVYQPENWDEVRIATWLCRNLPEPSLTHASKQTFVAAWLTDLLRREGFTLARAKGVHTALDTAGQPFRPDDPAYLAAFDRLMANTSLVILDLKEIDPERHRQLTGKDNANILAMARHISDLGIPLWIRHVLVPGLTDDEEGLRKTADFIRSLKTVQRVEVLPYHTLGLFKWQKLGIPYPLPDAVPPTAEQVKRAEELLEVSRYPG